MENTFQLVRKAIAIHTATVIGIIIFIFASPAPVKPVAQQVFHKGFVKRMNKEMYL